MSDPMTNTDVEDVLASIRRLVSDDGRQGAAAVQRPPSDRLVLTPSLRVTETVKADAEATDEDAAEPEIEAVAEDLSSQPFVSKDDQALASFVHSAFREEDPDQSEASVQDEAPSEEAPSEEVAASDDELSVDSADSEPGYDVDDAAQDLATEQEPHDPLPQSAVADVDDGADASDTAHVPEDWDGEADETPEDGHGNDQPKGAAHATSRSLSEKIAALETLVGERRDQFEPDDLGADAYAGTEPPAMEWEDAEREAEPDEETAEQHSDPDPDFEVVDVTPQEAGDAPISEQDTEADDPADAQAAMFPNEDHVLDEDALRELISDIVREELQGVLGERITRNVRKLVRREIHRALAAQDLE